MRKTFLKYIGINKLILFANVILSLLLLCKKTFLLNFLVKLHISMSSILIKTFDCTLSAYPNIII